MGITDKFIKNKRIAKKGMFFVTICSYKQMPIFSKIDRSHINSQPIVKLTEIGNFIERTIRFFNRDNEDFHIIKTMIMPDHIHMIVNIKKYNIHISSIIQRFKSYIANYYPKQNCLGYIGKIWHNNYYETFIKRKEQYEYVKKYIENNPKKWLEKNGYIGAGTPNVPESELV